MNRSRAVRAAVALGLLSLVVHATPGEASWHRRHGRACCSESFPACRSEALPPENPTFAMCCVNGTWQYYVPDEGGDCYSMPDSCYGCDCVHREDGRCFCDPPAYGRCAPPCVPCVKVFDPVTGKMESWCWLVCSRTHHVWRMYTPSAGDHLWEARWLPARLINKPCCP